MKNVLFIYISITTAIFADSKDTKMNTIKNLEECALSQKTFVIKNEYYIEGFHFNDDPYITSNILNRKNPRGGSGVISLLKKGNFHVAKRDIILGLNIPNY